MRTALESAYPPSSDARGDESIAHSVSLRGTAFHLCIGECPTHTRQADRYALGTFDAGGLLAHDRRG